MADRMELNQGLKARHINFIALGGIIGPSYFLGTGYLLNQIGPAAFIAYVIGGLITFFSMACLAELSTDVATTGSFIGYAKKYISPAWACGVGWSYWINWVIFIPAECVAGGVLMNNLAPEVPVYAWASIFAFLIAFFNLMKVKLFGEVSFWMSLLQIGVLFCFSLLAGVIFFNAFFYHSALIKGSQDFMSEGLFPKGISIFLVNMMLLMGNFHGSEIVGLSSSESANTQDIPKNLRRIATNITALYLIPIILLTLIFPWKQANLESSVFIEALKGYGLLSVGKILSFVIVAGSISCANSGLYATVRSLRALSLQGMAPKCFGVLSKNGVPINATLATLGSIAVLLFGSYFFATSKAYVSLLALSGFTGSICWISICWCQLRARKGRSKESVETKYKLFGFPYTTHMAIWVQIFFLCVVVWSDDLRASFYFGVPVLLIPMLIYQYLPFFKRALKKE